MDDPFLVRRLEGFGDLRSDAERLANRNGSARNPIGEPGSFHQLEDQGFRQRHARRGSVSSRNGRNFSS